MRIKDKTIGKFRHKPELYETCVRLFDGCYPASHRTGFASLISLTDHSFNLCFISQCY